MKSTAINIKQKYSHFSDQWQPRVIAQMNDYEFKIARIEGEFVWHKHDDTDEVFIIVEGEMLLELRDGSVPLKEGDLFVVPKGVEHKPVANKECKIMLVEPKGVINTGDADTDRKAKNDVWV
jgi:mannose-6-phosphate isomerase-like protein (cupin superfamily)